MNIRNLLLKISIPISKIIAKIQKPECVTTSVQYLDLKSKLKDGDVIMSTVGYSLANMAIPGDFKHCGIYFDGYIYEAVTHGVRRVLLEEYFFKKDIVGVARRIGGLTRDQRLLGLSFLVMNMNEEYDWSFDIDGTESWYCSKLCRAFFVAGDEDFEQSFILKEVFGEPTVKPTDFWLARKHFEQIVSYNLE